MSQFLLPDLGEGLEEAQLVQWLVNVGDRVLLNQPLCQVETAKAMVDIPSPFAGVVRSLHASPGDTVPVGTPLITIEEAGGASHGHSDAPAASVPDTANGTADGHGPVLVGYGTEGPAQTFTRKRRTAGRGEASPPDSLASAEARRNPAEGVLPSLPLTEASPPAPRPAAGVRLTERGETEVSASPLVRKMARERGVDLSMVSGSGPGGRIRVEDLEAALQNGVGVKTAAPAASAVVAQHAAPAAIATEPDEERISTVGLRKAIAARMVKSATTIPHFTEYGLFDATALTALRSRLRSDSTYAEYRLTFLPFFVRALVAAVHAYPIMNSRWDEEGNAIVVKRSIHVGIATDTTRGLIVPVIHNAHTLDLPQITAECDRLVRLGREGKLDAKALTGGSITITNVGAAGPVETGAPLINAPEVCIVGFGAIKPRPTVVEDHLEVRPGAWISISCDHRVVDGATAAQFMGELVQQLEHPGTLAATG